MELNELDNIIANLERQRDAIDKALEALREVSGIPTAVGRPAATKKTRGKKRIGLTAAGRKRLSENMRQRWAAKRTGKQARKSAKKKPASS